MSSKWHASGYLWSLEYLSCRVAEITDYVLREQDAYYRVHSSSLPTNLNQLFILMGCCSPGEDLDNEAAMVAMAAASSATGPADLIDLIDQIYMESDFFSRKHRREPINNNPTSATSATLTNMFDYVKRRKYEATFQARIR